MRAVKKHRHMTRAKLRYMYAANVSLPTIDQYLHQNNYRKWLAKKRPKLEDKHILQRLQWALEHKDWTHKEWEGVIWSDEYSVEKSDSGQQIWIFRQSPEKWFKDCIAPTRIGKGIFLMVWGCFCGRNHGTFGPLIVKLVNKSVYVKPRKYLFLPVLKCVHDTLADPILQHDNAPVYKAAVIMDFFEKYNILIEDWPPYSPDLNPIEHVWVELKHRLYRKYPDIGNTEDGLAKVTARLAQVLPVIWEEIPEAYIKKLWKSMPDRMAAVQIDAKGECARY